MVLECQINDLFVLVIYGLKQARGGWLGDGRREVEWNSGERTMCMFCFFRLNVDLKALFLCGQVRVGMRRILILKIK